MLREYSSDKASIICAVHIEVHIMLLSVKYLDKYVLAVRRPGDICEISLFAEVSDLKLCEDIAQCVADAHCKLLRIHSGHRILDPLVASGARGDIIHRVERYFALILAVYRHFIAVRRREHACAAAKLVAAHTLAVADVGIVTDW